MPDSPGQKLSVQQLVTPTAEDSVYVVQAGSSRRATVGGVLGLATKATVGLSNVDNTSDANKPISTATATALAGKVDTTDPRLTDAREWSASTVEQAEAEAGIATTRRAWTAQRVRQAVAAWWLATTSTAGRALATAADAAAQRLLLGLGSTDSPTFAGLTVSGTATLEHIHGALAGEVYQHIRAGASLSALTPYHVDGSQGDTDRVVVVAARGDTPELMPAAGLTSAALANNADGHGVIAGVMTNVNTAGLVTGDPLYVAPTGGITLTRPTTGLVQVVAIIGRVNANTGTLVLAVGPALPAWVYIDTTNAGNLSSGTLAAARLPASGVSPGAYGSGSQVGTFSVDTYGRLTTAGNQAISVLAAAISDSSVAGRALLTAAGAAAQRTALELGTAALAAAADLLNRANHTGTQPANTITGLAASATTDTTDAGNISSGTLGAARLPASGVTANTYGSGSQVPVLTVDATGRVTSASLASVHDPVTLGPSVSAVLDLTGQVLSADNPGGDRLLFYRVSTGALTHLSTDSSLVLDGTVLRALSTLVIPLTGEAASLTVATLVTIPYWPEARVFTALPIFMVNTAPTGSVAQLDIRVGGTSIFATLPTIDATETSTATAATPAVFSSAFIASGYTIALGSSVTFHCTQIGATIAGAGLKVALPSRRAS